ncbi:MAG: hypothetical protein ACK4UJ_10245 [Leptonema sp. (in: bacteria)]
MKVKSKYKLKETHNVCINIKLALYRELKRMAKGSVSLFLEYLYEKYKRRILNLQIASYKRSATAEYQPTGEEYKKMKIEIEPFLWQRYWDLRGMSGFSISFIITIFIQWELYTQNQNVDRSLLQKRNIFIEIQNFSYPERFPKINNYVLGKAWNRQKNEFSIQYWDNS